jgi:hypothetical protein
MGGIINYVTLAPSTEGVSGRVQTGIGHVSKGTEPEYKVSASINVPSIDTRAGVKLDARKVNLNINTLAEEVSAPVPSEGAQGLICHSWMF